MSKYGYLEVFQRSIDFEITTVDCTIKIKKDFILRRLNQFSFFNKSHLHTYQTTLLVLAIKFYDKLSKLFFFLKDIWHLKLQEIKIKQLLIFPTLKITIYAVITF